MEQNVRYDRKFLWPSGYERFVGTSPHDPRALSTLSEIEFYEHAEDGLGLVEEAVAHLPGHPMIAFRRYPDGPDPRTGIYVDARAASDAVVATLREIVRALETPQLRAEPVRHAPKPEADVPDEIESPAWEEAPAADADIAEEILSDSAALP